MALWNIFDPKLQRARPGLQSGSRQGDVLQRRARGAHAAQRIPKGDTIEEDHQRDRQLIVNYIMDKTGAIEKVERDGKTYMVIKDFDKMKEGVGMLLAELMRIKAEGDYDAIKALVDSTASTSTRSCATRWWRATTSSTCRRTGPASTPT